MRNSPNNLMFLLNYISFRFAKIPNSVMGSPRSDLHLVLIPGLHFLSAACWDLLILALHIRDDVLHVQHPSVVHLHYNRRVLHFSLQLLQFLHTHTHTQRERGTRFISGRLGVSFMFLSLNYLFIEALEKVQVTQDSWYVLLHCIFTQVRRVHILSGHLHWLAWQMLFASKRLMLDSVVLTIRAVATVHRAGTLLELIYSRGGWL